MKTVKESKAAEQQIEKAMAFSRYDGSASAWEFAARKLLRDSSDAWQNGSEDLAYVLRDLSRKFTIIAVEERDKQQKTGYIKL